MKFGLFGRVKFVCYGIVYPSAACSVLVIYGHADYVTFILLIKLISYFLFLISSFLMRKFCCNLSQLYYRTYFQLRLFYNLNISYGNCQ